MRSHLIVQFVVLVSFVSLQACDAAQDDVAQDVASSQDLQGAVETTVKPPVEQPVREPADVEAQIEGLQRCLGTWDVSADSGKFDRTGYTFTVKIERDSLMLYGHTGQLDDGSIGYALADVTVTPSGWSGITDDGFLRNETTWKFTSKTTSILDVNGYRTENNEYLGQKRIFLTKK